MLRGERYLVPCILQKDKLNERMGALRPVCPPHVLKIANEGLCIVLLGWNGPMDLSNVIYRIMKVLRELLLAYFKRYLRVYTVRRFFQRLRCFRSTYQ